MSTFDEMIEEQLRQGIEESRRFSEEMRERQKASNQQADDLRRAILERKAAEHPVTQNEDIAAVVKLLAENPILAPKVRQFAEKLRDEVKAKIDELVGVTQ